jgi:hypothetical protein
MSRYPPSDPRVTGDAGGVRRCPDGTTSRPATLSIGTFAECARERTKVHNDLLVNCTRNISAPDSGARPGMQRERANVGVFITLAEPTGSMRTEAVRAGFYEPAYGERPNVQLLSAELSRRQKASPAMARPWRVQEGRARGSPSWRGNKAAALRERIKCQRMG